MRKYGLFSVLVVPLFSLLLGCSSVPKPKLLLTSKEAKTAEAGLSGNYKQFLEDVGPIMSAAEKDKFLFLKEDFEREAFIEKFWRARAKLDGGGQLDFRSVYYERLAEVREQIRNPKVDSSRWYLLTFNTLKSIEPQRNPALIYLLNGPPSGSSRIDCENRLWPIQIWWYGYLPSLHKRNVVLMFVKSGGFNYRLWLPQDGPSSLLVEASITNPMGGTGLSREDMITLQSCFDSSGGMFWRQ